MTQILVTENLKKYFGSVHAVDNVNISIKEGEIISVVGPNGAGKTTLINILSGVLKPDSGKVIFLGRNITGLPPHKVAKIGIARSFQIVQLFENLTVLDSLRSAIFSVENKSRRMLSLVERDVHVKEEAFKILDSVGLSHKSYVFVRELSHGERKLLDVALALALKPKLLLLDEPTSGVSIKERDEVMRTIKSIIENSKISALIVEHDMHVVASYTERVLVMHEGKIVADGIPEKILSNEEIKNILLGV
jgi:branched-chain amino acid transport system ATP-binding protein